MIEPQTPPGAADAEVESVQLEVESAEADAVGGQVDVGAAPAERGGSAGAEAPKQAAEAAVVSQDDAEPEVVAAEVSAADAEAGAAEASAAGAEAEAPDAQSNAGATEVEAGGAEPVEEPRGRLSNRERRIESDALSDLARQLVEMRPSQLAEVSLPPEVTGAIATCRGFRKSAWTTQVRLISTMLRRLDIDELTAEVADAGHKQRGRAQREQVYEQWRERLVGEGDRALTEFIDAHPMADPQRLRSLLRAARRSPGSGKSKQALRSVLRLIREALEVEHSVGGPPSGG